MQALNEFRSPPVNLEGFKESGYVIRIGSSPTQIDIINSASGIDINDCYKRKKIIDVEDIKINIISRDDLIKNKRTSARNIDIFDADNIEKQIQDDKMEKKDG